MITFYTNPQSRGNTVHWMLEEIGVPYEARSLIYGDQMKAPEYLAINPMGKVPAIVHQTQNEKIIVTECAAICAYLADAFPAAKLAPDLNNRADYYRWLFFVAGPVEQMFADQFRKLNPNAEEQKSLGYGTSDFVLNALNIALTQHSSGWIAGDQFTAADIYIGSYIDFSLQFGYLPKKPSFEAYAEKVRARAAYQTAQKKIAELMKS